MFFTPSHLLLPLSILILAGCAGQKHVFTLKDSDDCSPLQLTQGQELILTLPSDPTTGFRWEILSASACVLTRLSPEVYSNLKDGDLVGSGGESTWRFRASASGDDQLQLVYRRPWEKDVVPAKIFSCQIQVR